MTDSTKPHDALLALLKPLLIPIVREAMWEVQLELENGKPVAANDEGTLDKAAAAKFLRVSPGQVDKLIKDKGLPYHRVGDVKRIFRDELIAWVKAQASE
ncbi:MAG TPA: helix-turn-helix domain-containing protein [Polyangiaceae bacterium]